MKYIVMFSGMADVIVSVFVSVAKRMKKSCYKM